MGTGPHESAALRRHPGAVIPLGQNLSQGCDLGWKANPEILKATVFDLDEELFGKPNWDNHVSHVVKDR